MGRARSQTLLENVHLAGQHSWMRALARRRSIGIPTVRRDSSMKRPSNRVLPIRYVASANLVAIALQF